MKGFYIQTGNKNVQSSAIMVRTWYSLADCPRGSLTIIQYSTLPTSTPPLPVY